MIIFSDKIFILIPKCGCTSLMDGHGVNPWGKNLENKHNNEDALLYLKGGSPHIPASQTPEKFKHLPTEAIVRNPWDRTVSMYYYLTKKTNSDISFKDFVINKYKFEVDWPTNEGWGPHSWAQQVEYLNPDTKVHRFEEYNFVVHLNKTKHEPYTKLYDNELHDLIATYFKDDIERFNYEFWPE